MKVWYFFSLIMFASCANKAHHQSAYLIPSVQKQKQRIAFLQKKLESAQKEEEKAKLEVENIQTQLEETQIALIKRKMDQIIAQQDKLIFKMEDGQSLFLTERETLYKIIQNGPSVTSFDAEVELNRILRIITEICDEGL